MESLNERYHRETGLHSHYSRLNPKNKKKELTYTRKYVWWLECLVKDFIKAEEERNEKI